MRCAESPLVAELPRHLAYAFVLVSIIGVLAVAEGLFYRHVLGGRLPPVKQPPVARLLALADVVAAPVLAILFATRQDLPVVDRVLVGVIVFDLVDLLLWVAILGAVQSTYPASSCCRSSGLSATSGNGFAQCAQP